MYKPRDEELLISQKTYLKSYANAFEVPLFDDEQELQAYVSSVAQSVPEHLRKGLKPSRTNPNLLKLESILFRGY